MNNNQNVVNSSNQDVKERIKNKVLGYEKANYDLKPDGGKSDTEMVDLIKKIIETEVKK